MLHSKCACAETLRSDSSQSACAAALESSFSANWSGIHHFRYALHTRKVAHFVHVLQSSIFRIKCGKLNESVTFCVRKVNYFILFIVI